VELSVDRRADGLERARVEYDIHFSEAERRLGLRFLERIILIEQDEAADFLSLGLDANFWNRETGTDIWQVRFENLDEFVGTVTPFPAGSELIADGEVAHRLHERAWDFGHQERGEEEYVAIVHVVPEICSAGGRSEVFKANLGRPPRR
jgi:hypothetical protein